MFVSGRPLAALGSLAAKPEPELYLRTCRKLAVAPLRAAFVDDRLESVAGALVKFGEYATPAHVYLGMPRRCAIPGCKTRPPDGARLSWDRWFPT